MPAPAARSASASAQSPAQASDFALVPDEPRLQRQESNRPDQNRNEPKRRNELRAKEIRIMAKATTRSSEMNVYSALLVVSALVLLLGTVVLVAANMKQAETAGQPGSPITVVR